ncbi:MAG: tetratricopeptide repeat protein [Bacteroidetes bacterium]|nr:tetratricopeptide repeat protein [Bacteroidota bacterium]
MNTKELEQRYAKAVAAHKAGRLAEAELLYGQILKDVPLADAVLTNMAAIQYTKGNFDQALKYVDKALIVNPINLDAVINRASTLLAVGEQEQAIQAYQQVLHLDEKNALAHYNLGNIFFDRGEFAMAEKKFKRATALNPELFQGHFNLGNVLAKTDRPIEALSSFEKALSVNPAHVGANHNLAALLSELGDWPAAWRQLNLGLEILPDAALLWTLKGKFLSDVGRFEEALAAIEKALEIDPTLVDRWIQKGNTLRDMRRIDDARLAFERALLIQPGHSGAARNLQLLLADQVPAWHFSMLADEGRNRAYDKVLRSLMQPGDTVLDIGTGSGLLAMMAIRAGASEVIACEREPAIAEVAKAIILKNGYADKVKVHALDSRLLKLGKEVAERVDVIVSEILDVSLLGEGMLPSIRAALRSLAHEDTRVIPAGATVMVQLIELPESYYDPGLENVEGFDLREFDKFRQAGGRKTMYLRSDHDYGVSEILPLRVFDFLRPGKAISEEEPERFSIRFENVENKNIDGILMWFELELDADTLRSSGPGGEFEHWGQAFYPLTPAPEPGKPVTIDCEVHDFGWGFKVKGIEKPEGFSEAN